MWKANNKIEVLPAFKGSIQPRKDFKSVSDNYPSTYSLQGTNVYITHVKPYKGLKDTFFTDKGIDLKQTIIASNLHITSLQGCTGDNELVIAGVEIENSDELGEFYLLSNNLNPKQVTLGISFTGVEEPDLIRPFITQEIITFQESDYSVSRFIPFVNITTLEENNVITQYTDTDTDNLFINKKQQKTFLYKIYNLSELPEPFNTGNFDSIEDSGKIYHRQLDLNGQGFFTSERFLFISKRNVD